MGWPIALTLLTFGAGGDAPTFSKDVAPILQAKCQACHRPGQVGPFPLLSYKDAKRWSATLAEVVAEGRMPPWGADPAHGQFANDRSLSPDQKATLLAWAKAGCPEGDPQRAPAPRQFAGDWQLGTPDAVFTMSKAFDVPAEGTVRYQYFVIPTNLTEDRWVQGYEIRPGNRAVVHHILVFVAGGNGPPGELGEEGGAGGGQFAGYVPGDDATIFPEGMGKKLPAGSRLVFQVHYTPTGKATADRSSIALKYADKPVTQEVRTKGIFQRRFTIPAGAAAHPVESSWTVPGDATLLSLWPHMHLRGKDFRFTAKHPDGRSEILLDVPAYDFNWQTTYVLAEPKKLPAGTKLDCLAHYDNSAANPHNPDPTKAVRWGDQTDEEMLIGYVDYVLDGPAPGGGERVRNRIAANAGGPGPFGGRLLPIFGDGSLSAEAKADKVLALFDKDGDGRIGKDEVPNPENFARFDPDGDGAMTRDDLIRFAELAGPLLKADGGDRPREQAKAKAAEALRGLLKRKDGKQP